MQLENKVALITGASSGIGRAAALAFAREGAKLLLADINTDAAEETLQQVEAAGASALFVKTDVSKAANVQTMVNTIVTRYGGLDIAVNNAGIGGGWLRFQDVDEAMFDQVMAVNVKGVWLCMKYEIEALLQNADGGSIINTASVAGLIGSPKLAVYAASKHAVIGLTKSAALELARKNIRVNAVCPSWLNTPMVSALEDDNRGLVDVLVGQHPMRRLGTPEEVAEAILWLASEKASFVNGVALATDGGFTA